MISPDTKRRVSPLTKEQWDSLETKARVAVAALEDLGISLIHCAAAADEKDPAWPALTFEAKRVNELKYQLLPAYFYHPQPEWTGGDSSDPKNHVLREPHILGMLRRTVLP